MPDALHPRQPIPERGRGARLARALGPVLAATAVAATLGVAAAVAYRLSAGAFRADREREIATLATVKAEAVERWRRERLSDALVLSRDPAIREAAVRGDVATLRAELAEWFETLRDLGDYAAVAFVREDGTAVFTIGSMPDEAHDPDLAPLIARAVAARAPLLSDVHRYGPDDPPHLNLVAPIDAGPGGAGGAVLLRLDPRAQLFRMVAGGTAALRSGEVMLLRAEAGQAVLLSPLSSGDTAALGLRYPLAGSTDPGARALLGAKGVSLARDYRGVEVLAAAEPVGGSRWVVLARVDADEVFAPIAERLRWALTFAATVTALAAALATLWWRARLTAEDRERIRQEAKRDALRNRLERLTAWSHDLVFLADGDHVLLEVNQRAVEALGYPREELIGMPVRALRDPATLGDFDARVSEELARGGIFFETRYRRRDGSTFPVEVSVHVEEVEGRRIFQGIARDIGDRHRALDALAASEAKFRAAFEKAHLGILMADADGRVLETNASFRALLGYEEEADLRGRSVRELVFEDDRPIVLPDMGGLRTGRHDVHEGPRRYLRKDGTPVEVFVRVSAVRNKDGAFLFSIAVVEDLSAKRRLETQLHVAERMASLGTLAAGVAHEINNPLAFVLANVDFARRQLAGRGGAPEVLAALDEAHEGGTRVREIVRDLKSFSRMEDAPREAVDLRRAMQSALALAANELRHRARLEVVLEATPPVMAGEHRLGQVFLNLLVNAAQAIPEGATADHLIRATTGTAADGRAFAEVSDTGAGIPPALLGRIFDPFFTTKAVGVGTGLGLSICHGIVSGMGGEIHVESAPGRGSTFRVLLPAAAAGAAAEAGAPAAAPLASSTRGRVLVVDDEPLIARAVRRILSPPFEVVVRASAREALTLLSGGDGAEHFDLVLCDLMMPEMTGMELHDRVSAAAPAVAERFVFLTGGAFTTSAREFLERVKNPRVEKPFDGGALKELVASTIASARAP